MVSQESCSTCLSAKVAYECEICKKGICKECLQYVDTATFSFMSKVPKILRGTNFCRLCFDEHIVPGLAHYNELMEKAKDIYFLPRSYGGYVHVLKRHTKRVSVEICDDRRETIMRLAFFAAELKFNAIIEGDVESKKVLRGGGYKTSTWTGSALPADINAEQLERSSLRRI